MRGRPGLRTWRRIRSLCVHFVERWPRMQGSLDKMSVDRRYSIGNIRVECRQHVPRVLDAIQDRHLGRPRATVLPEGDRAHASHTRLPGVNPRFQICQLCSRVRRMMQYASVRICQYPKPRMFSTHAGCRLSNGRWSAERLGVVPVLPVR